ncbi:MAG: hypothetical protein EPO30_01235 [Lysobacteraceae bacterium]|nr:MAG: hypothetical protein EPO30_01235 [Xanthomonadaceae bacterium]
MNHIFRNGIVLPIALGALLATSLGATAAPARDRDNDNDRQEQRQDRQDKRKEKRQQQREERREQRQEQRQERREDRREVRQDRRDDRPAVAPVIVRPGHPPVVRQVDQGRRYDRRDDRRDDRQDRRQERREDRREARHDRREDRRDARQDYREDRREYRQDLRERRAHQRYRDDYYRRLRTMQSRHYTPYWYHSGNYRYYRGNQWHRVNYYGADLLRRAVDLGYREGLRAGQADRYDRWHDDYRRSFVWMDASYGYRPGYVSRSEYNYYFRQGFQRGYEDGYYDRYRYGRRVNGEVIIIDAILRAILDLQRWG